MFSSLLEQIKSQKCKAVVGVLTAAKSKSLIRWRQLDIRITDAANEAKDNVKYLYTLDKFFGPLVKFSPVSTANVTSKILYKISVLCLYEICVVHKYNWMVPNLTK